MYALFHFKGFKLTFGIGEIIGFEGTPLLLRIELLFYKTSLYWVCDKPSFSGSFAVVILMLKENGEKFKNLH
jgi:hypothetical protein